MNLRHKVLITLGIAFLVIIFVLFAISSTYLISSYENLESTYISHEVSLVRSHLDSRITDLHVLAGDWGVWEDMYLFANGKNPGFTDEMVHPEVLANININLLLITDNKGKLVYGTGFDTRTGQMVPVPAAILAELADPTTPLHNMSMEKQVKGIISLPGGPMLIGAHPILHADLSGPPAGMVIMGRYVDETMIRNIGTTSLNTITLHPLLTTPGNETGLKNSGTVPAGITTSTKIRSSSSDAGEILVVIQPMNDTLVGGSTVLTDIRGNDALTLNVQMSRDIYQQGKNTIFSFLLILVNIALVIGIIVIYLIDNLVLSRITALQNDIDALGKRGDLSSRLNLKGNDEVSFLAAAMNQTLDKLETAQKNLQKSETSYRTLIETSPTSIAQTDLSGTILYCNRQMAIAHGYGNAEELIGKFIFDFIAPSDRDRAMMDLAMVLKEGHIRNIEYRAVKKDGSVFWIEKSISLLMTPQGSPESFIVVSRDISHRKTWEDQLKESEERYRTVFENTGTATVILNEQAVITLANTEFARLCGYSRTEIEGKKRWTEFVVRDDLDRMLTLHRQRRVDPGSTLKKYEFRFVTKSGDMRDILLSVDIIPHTTMSIASLIDITERKRAETAIVQSENKLNTIIESSPIPQFVIDKDHHVIHWNRALEHLTGVHADTVLGTDRHWRAFYSGKRPCIADLVVDGLIGQIPEKYHGKFSKSEFMSGMYEVTDFFPHLGGTGKWLYFTSTQIRDSQGMVTGAVETLVDITQQKNFEEEITRTNAQLTSALQELKETEEVMKENIAALEDAKRAIQKSEAKYRDIATNLPGIVFQFIVHEASDYSIPFISDRIISMFTLGPDEIYSNPNALFNLIHEDDVDIVRTSLLESARSQVPWNIEFRMKSRGTEPSRWFNGRGIPHVLDMDNILFDGVLIDITERKLAEESLFESEYKFHAIFEQSSEFIGLMSVDGTLIKANRTALTFSGMTDESEVIGRPFWETPWWTHSPEMQELLKTAITRAAAGEFIRFEATHPCSDGSIRYIDFSLKPVLDESGKVVLLIPEGHDITERKVLQEEIGTALKEKELLLKEIHHRVKNNIQVIASLLNMQSRTVEDLKTREVLREAQNRVKSIALVHEKLYQSKSLDRIDYNDYLQKISRHLYDSYGVSPRNVVMSIHADNISLHIDKAVPCSLIINELLSNAFKHAFPDGRKGDIWIEMHKNGESLLLQYRDNGVGLPEDISVEKSESLGMRLLYGLTRQLHGTIKVQRLNGTHITITFPYEPAKESAA